MNMRLRNIEKNTEHDIAYNGDDVYLDGVPAIVNGSVTSFFEEIKKKKYKTNLDPDKYDLFSMYDVDDDIMFVEIEELVCMDRSVLLAWVRKNRAHKYVNIFRSNLSIVRDILELKKKVLERNYIEVNHDG